MAQNARRTKAFDEDPDSEYDFWLARKLGMSVHEMRERISNDEWVSWHAYDGRMAQRRELAWQKQSQ